MRSYNRLFAAAFGLLFLALGAAGFVVSFGRPPLDVEGVPLLGFFTANPLQSVLSMATGAVLLVPALTSSRTARRVNAILGAALLASGIAGLYVIGTPANVLALNATDILLQFAAAAFLLGASLGADRARASQSGGPLVK